MRLPAPFSRLPVADGATFYSGQGYGLNTFAYRNPNIYEATNHIHSGLDFGGEDSMSPATCLPDQDGLTLRCIRIVSVCDGIVVDPNGTTGADTGSGMVVRCFAPEGSRSNLYVSYNHLQDIEDLSIGAIVRAGEERGLNAFQYPNNNFPHLHLEVFYDRDENLSNAVRLNPLLFFGQDQAEIIKATISAYYPEVSIRDGDERLFEVAPAETTDPVPPPPTAYDAVTFNNGNQGLLPSQADELVDLDLGIQVDEISSFSIVGDYPELASGDTVICTFVWSRTDQPVIFRYSPTGSCPTTGTQSISLPPSNGYNGPEWLAGRWIVTNEILLIELLRHDI